MPSLAELAAIRRDPIRSRLHLGLVRDAPDGERASEVSADAVGAWAILRR